MELNNYINMNNELEENMEKLNELRKRASQRSKAIFNIVDELSKEEYKTVGPALTKFYKKLAKYDTKNEIRIIQKNNGISLVDNTDKNIVNVLSNGQISVFMLAHFFAGINIRNTYEKMKIYFIDYLTACMDDVNMLAFMDLLKYHLLSKSTMEQLFFITCDDRISNLLKYKLNGCGIEVCELREKDF
jgi:exonuclease SbcC